MRKKMFSVPTIIYMILTLLILSSFRVFFAGSEDYSGGIINELQLQKAYAQDVPYTNETEPEISTLTINKSLISGVWHVGCDVMGTQAWVKDEISNPKGIKSREGHRLAYCGDPSHWIIYLNTSGRPFAMDEIKSGATGGTLHTKFFTDATYTEEKNISEIQIGERIYWTTWNKDQVWHHTGITTPEVPEFTFVVDGMEYAISPGESLSLNLPVGVYEITEKYTPEYFVAEVSIPYVVTEDSNVVATVCLNANQETVVNFTNQRITPPEPQTDPPQTEPQTEQQTEPQTDPPEPQTDPHEPETDPPIIEAETESETETETETETQTQTQTEFQSQTQFQSETETQSQSETQTEPVTQPPTQAHTQARTQKITQKITQKVIVPQTQLKNETELKRQTESPTPETTPTPKTTPPLETTKVEDTPVHGNPIEQGLVVQPKRNNSSGVQGAHDPRDDSRDNRRGKTQGALGENRNEEAFIQEYAPNATRVYIPKTGDDSPILKFVCSLLLSFTVVLVLAYVIRNRRD